MNNCTINALAQGHATVCTMPDKNPTKSNFCCKAGCDHWEATVIPGVCQAGFRSEDGKCKNPLTSISECRQCPDHWRLYDVVEQIGPEITRLIPDDTVQAVMNLLDEIRCVTVQYDCDDQLEMANEAISKMVEAAENCQIILEPFTEV